MFTNKPDLLPLSRSFEWSKTGPLDLNPERPGFC